MYDNIQTFDFSNIEKKSKQNGLCGKEAVTITFGETQAIANGRLEWFLFQFLNKNH